jgi:aspartate/methionine/tyrosine aminotransferase
MSALIDVPARYDLAESTCPALRIDEIIDPEALARVELGYGTTRGDEELRSLIAADCGVTAEQVLLTTGAAEAMFLLAQDCRDGRVLLATPCYPPARIAPEGLGSPVDTVRLRFDDGYRLPVDAMADALRPTTRLVSLASPQNPSGVRFTDAALRELLAAMQERAPEAVLLVDETYRASTYGDAEVPRSAAALSPRVVTSSSVSKAHGAAGLRLGWLTTADPALYERLRAAKFATHIAGPTPDEILADRLLRRQADVLAPRAAFLARTLAELERWAATQPVDLLRPDGGALCCLRLPADRVPAEAVPAFYAALAERSVRVAPGSWFGEDDRVFRLGFGHLPFDEFIEALGLLAEAVSAVQAGPR